LASCANTGVIINPKVKNNTSKYFMNQITLE